MGNPVVAVTGSEGFIGSNLVRFLRTNGYTVWTLDRVGDANYRGDLQDLNAWPPLNGVAAVVNCAASTSVHVPDEHEQEVMLNNVLVAHNALHACFDSAVPVLINLSSSSVYGNLPVPFVEGNTAPLGTYGASKLRAEEALAQDAERLDVKVLSLRLFNVIGTGQRQDMLPWKICESFRTGKAITLFGHRRRCWTSVYDVVRAITYAILRDDKLQVGHTVMNYGTEISLSQVELFLKFEQHLNGWHVPYAIGDEHAYEAVVTQPDMTIAKEFYPETVWPSMSAVDRAVKEVLFTYCTDHGLVYGPR